MSFQIKHNIPNESYWTQTLWEMLWAVYNEFCHFMWNMFRIHFPHSIYLAYFVWVAGKKNRSIVSRHVCGCWLVRQPYLAWIKLLGPLGLVRLHTWSALRNGKWTAFVQRFSDLWPLKAPYNVWIKPTHSRLCTWLYHARQQTARQEQLWLRYCSERPLHLAKTSRGIRPAIFQLPDRPLYLLSNSPL